ncbi:DUF6518 family protein [Pseudonocardia sp. DLS-67]
MEFVLTNLRYQGDTLTEWALTGAIGATALRAVFGVPTLREFLVWGACGVLSGVLFGVGSALRRTHRLRRARDRARELLGQSATDAECALAVRAAVRGPVPGEPKIRRAAVQLTADLLLEHMPRKRVIGLVVGGMMIIFAVGDAALEDLSYWYLAGAGWGMLLPQLSSWRAHRRVDRLRGKAEA